LKAAGLEPDQADMTMIASTEVELDLDGAEKMLKLVEHLEDLDDVQNVYSNANISDEIAEQL
jgi:transcriptional/translational regulatory protein YebC/TACO1